MSNDLALILSIGGGAAIILAALIFAMRNKISAWRMSFLQTAASTRERLNRTVDARYREAIIEQANGWHVAGHLAPLEQVAILPRFFGLPDPYDPLEEEPDGYDGPLNLVPVTPDLPQGMAPYNLPSISIERVLRGSDNLALLGLPGSGRSATLALMTILAARQKEDNQMGGLLDIARIPVLFHMADLDLSPETWGASADPLEPMLAAAGRQMRSLAEQYLHAVQGQFATGYGLILADGWDELTPQFQRQATEWLRILLATYPGNKVVVSGPVQGYKPLQELGLAPTFILPWGQIEIAEITRLWAAAWPTIGGTPKQPASEPDAETMRKASRGNRSRSALDIVLKVWATYAGDDPGQSRRGWYSAYINRILPARDLRGALERLGERDLATANQMGLTSQEVNAVIDAARATLSQKASISTPDLLYSITNQTHVLAERTSKRVTFTQPVIAAYLAAESMRDAPFSEALLDGRLQSNMTLSFLAQLQDISPYVERQINQPDDVLRSRMLSLAMWAADADPQARWRGDAFKRLAQLALAPSQFPAARERAVAALVASRDSNVGFIFREGLKSSEPRIRLLSALGLGGLGDPEAVTALGEIINDADAGVVVAATLALGAIGTKPALDYMIQVLLTGIEMARRAAAEMFANNIAGEGHELLREGIKEQDYMTRRAAVFGLQRIQADWIQPLLQDAQLHDDQWLVRSAASTALEKLKQSQEALPRHRPLPEETSWLAKWLSERDENVSAGSAGVGQMIRALQDGDDPTRLAAAEALGALGTVESVTPLYAALRDSHAEVRDAAYRALAATSTALGRSFPGVM